jgi:hypothetical protein
LSGSSAAPKDFIVLVDLGGEYKSLYWIVPASVAHSLGISGGGRTQIRTHNVDKFPGRWNLLDSYVARCFGLHASTLARATPLHPPDNSEVGGRYPRGHEGRADLRRTPETRKSPKVHISVRSMVSYPRWPSFPAAGGAGACSILATAERARTTKAMTCSPEPARSLCHGCDSRADRVAATAGDPRIVGSVQPTAADRRPRARGVAPLRRTNLAPPVTSSSSCCFSRLRKSCPTTTCESATVGRVCEL